MDLGKFLGNELEEAASPVTQRIDRVIQKLDEIEDSLRQLNELVEQAAPLIRLLARVQQWLEGFGKRAR
jgi:ABC-type transporter Mla subunit MlaD